MSFTCVVDFQFTTFIITNALNIHIFSCTLHIAYLIETAFSSVKSFGSVVAVCKRKCNFIAMHLMADSQKNEDGIVFVVFIDEKKPHQHSWFFLYFAPASLVFDFSYEKRVIQQRFLSFKVYSHAHTHTHSLLLWMQ